MIVDLIEFLRKRTRGLSAVFFGIICAILIWSLTVDTHHAHTWAEAHIPFFWSLFGLVSCVVIIFFARWFANSGIATREDYYDN